MLALFRRNQVSRGENGEGQNISVSRSMERSRASDFASLIKIPSPQPSRRLIAGRGRRKRALEIVAAYFGSDNFENCLGLECRAPFYRSGALKRVGRLVRDDSRQAFVTICVFNAHSGHDSFNLPENTCAAKARSMLASCAVEGSTTKSSE